MNEIEVKILDINPEDVRKKLKALGATKFFDGEVHAIYFDTPDRQLKKAEKILRVRGAGDRVELCVKNKREKSTLFKKAEEIEVLTNDFKETVALVQMLGYQQWNESKRRRECYKLGDVKFDMDHYQTMPSCIEIEAPTEELVEEYVKKLGFTMKQTTNMTAHEVEDYYKRKL